MNTDGLRGFTTLRTRPLIPMSEQPEPARHCVKCGARLRRSNPGPTCATQKCSEMRCEELTDWERTLVESSPHGAQLVAKMRGAGCTDLAARNAHVRGLSAQGLSRRAISERMGIAQGTVSDIIRRRHGSDQ